MLPYVQCSAEYGVDNNPYTNIYVDLTQRCNMSCNYCYSPAREDDDLDISYFEEVCRRLPQPVYFRLLGGEPTLHPQFFDFIQTARKYNHIVYFSSNGLRYNDISFVRELQKLNGQYIPGISMDGGCRQADIYKLINDKDCMAEKMRAIETLVGNGIKRICLSAILVRGMNESIIPELLDLAMKYPQSIRYIHFRSAANIGRFVETKPYSLSGLKQLLRPHFTGEQFSPRSLHEISCPDETGECCYRFRPTPRLQVALVEFASRNSVRCTKRGRLLNKGFLIQPLFENMIKTAGMMAERVQLSA